MRRGKVDRELRRENAQNLAALRATRSDAQQLKMLEGASYGHCKEAKRLRKRIEKVDS